MEECISFAEKAGFMGKDELEQARKMLPLMRSGETPGSCKSKDECEAFAKIRIILNSVWLSPKKAGFMSGKELEMVKKTGGERAR